MPIFVDFVGMNTLISSSFDGFNVLFSSVNTEVGTIPVEEKLVGINLHRNGPYGFSSWKQVRASENPISRNHRKINKLSFVVQPGEVRNVLSNGELRVRDRYSVLYNYTEPAVCQKSYPLVWNVGRHFKDEDGNVDLQNPNRFSIISSYGNQQIAFANEQVNKLLKFDPDEEQTEYVAIKDMYLENGLNKQDSPLTYWEFLQYRETVFPTEARQFILDVRNRNAFESFYKHKRTDRTKNIETSSFNFTPYGSIGSERTLSQSSWPLDEAENFLTIDWGANPQNAVVWRDPQGGGSPPTVNYFSRNGEGVLMNTLTQFSDDMSYWSSNLESSNPINVNLAITGSDGVLSPSPLYMRRSSLPHSESVSNPSGMEIPETGSISYAGIFQGGALWEAGDKRYIRNDSGQYISSPKKPFYNSYRDYGLEVKNKGKNYSIVPEFRMSTQIKELSKEEGIIPTSLFEITGADSKLKDSSEEEFYDIYSTTDFMKSFEIINSDHEDFTNGKVLSLRCKAIKKFLPYEGFYPCQRTVQLSEQFYDSYRRHTAVRNEQGIQIGQYNFANQFLMTPLFAPGVLFNTIKSGVAVDYPIITSSFDVHDANPGRLIVDDFNKRIPFEALIEPEQYLAGFTIRANEPHPSGTLSASVAWDGNGDGFYRKMANNFLSETIEFFLEDQNLSSISSKTQSNFRFRSGSVYGMRVKMRRSMGTDARVQVYHSGQKSKPYFTPQDIISSSAQQQQVRESFTMYSKPSAFGPPTFGKTIFNSAFFDDFETNGNRIEVKSGTQIDKNSLHGYNFPFTPPYYHGEAWCDIVYTASSNNPTLEEIQENATFTYSRFDYSHYTSNGSNIQQTTGSQALANINKNAVQLSSSLNINGAGKIRGKLRGNRRDGLVVDTGINEDFRWIIQTKFETPMLNFNHVLANNHLTLPLYDSGSVPRGMWHQHGRIPENEDGVFMEVVEIPENYQEVVMGRSSKMRDLSKAVGFSNEPVKLGRLAPTKTISEAVVAVPFVQNEGRKKFFKIDPKKVRLYKEGKLEELTQGDPQSQIGRSVLLQMDKMKKFIFPPSFDFLNFDDVTPIAMYVFEFSHTLTQQDLSDIWQNLPPDIGTEMEVSEVAITHPLLRKELLGQGGESGNATIDMPDKLKWMVFKVKQRAASNYFKKTVLRNAEVNTDVESGNVTNDEFGDTSVIQYNWPYDFFSLVEMVKIDAEVELGNIDFSNYTDNIPAWDAQMAVPDKIKFVVGDMGDEPIPEVFVQEEVEEEGVDTGVDEVIVDDDGESKTRSGKKPKEGRGSGRRFEIGSGRRGGKGDQDSGGLLSRRQEAEGITDPLEGYSSSTSFAYVSLKGIFSIQFNLDPLESFEELWSRSIQAFNSTGLDLGGNIILKAKSWAQEWIATSDSALETRGEEAANQQAQDDFRFRQEERSRIASVIKNNVYLSTYRMQEDKILVSKADARTDARFQVKKLDDDSNFKFSVAEYLGYQSAEAYMNANETSWLEETNYYD